jgi:hypothetical protein
MWSGLEFTPEANWFVFSRPVQQLIHNSQLIFILIRILSIKITK